MTSILLAVERGVMETLKPVTSANDVLAIVYVSVLVVLATCKTPGAVFHARPVAVDESAVRTKLLVPTARRSGTVEYVRRSPLVVTGVV